MLECNKAEIRKAMRNDGCVRVGAGIDDVAFRRSDICSRTFTVYFGIDPEHPHHVTKDARLCREYVGDRCYRIFHGGLMEVYGYRNESVMVSCIETPGQVQEIVMELRRMGVRGDLHICVFYVAEGQGCIVKVVK